MTISAASQKKSLNWNADRGMFQDNPLISGQTKSFTEDPEYQKGVLDSQKKDGSTM